MLDVLPLLNAISKFLDTAEFMMIFQLSAVFVFGFLLFFFILVTKAVSTIPIFANVSSKVNFGALWLSLVSMIGASLLSSVLFLSFDTFIMPVLFDSVWASI